MAKLKFDAKEMELLCRERQMWENQLRSLRELWSFCWTRWRIVPLQPNERRDPDNQFQSQVRVPYGFHHVETAVPRVVGADPRMSYRALDYVEDTPVSQIQGGVSSWQMERMAFKLYLKRFARQGLVTGYTVAKVGWVKTVEDRTFTERAAEFDPHLQDVFHVDQQRHQRVVTKNSPFFDPVNVIDFVFPLECRNLDECPAVWQRRRVTLKYLREMAEAGIYKNVDDVRGEAREGANQRYWSEQLQQQGSNVTDLGYDEKDDRAEVDLWERWQNDRCTALTNVTSGSAVCVRDDPNPFWHRMKPFVDYSPYPEVFQMPGQGIIAVVEDLNESLNTLRRQRDDALAYVVAPAMKGRGIDGNQLTMFPGFYQEVDDLTDLEPIFVPNVDFGSSERMEERIILDMQNITGMSAALSGSISDAGQIANTATGVQSVTSESNKRAEEMISELAERTMKRFGVMLASMNAQFLEGDVAADFSKDPNAMQAWLEFHEASRPPVDGFEEAGVDDAPQAPPQVPANGIVVVDADWLKARGRLEPLPKVGQDEEISKIQRRSDVVQFTQALGPFLAMVPPPVNMKALVEWLAEQFDVPKDVRDRILDNQNEVQQAELAQMAEVMGGAGGAGVNGSGPSGPSGDPAATGMVGGAPGVAGV